MLKGRQTTAGEKRIVKMPTIPELADRYGNPENNQLFRFRDLLLKWQQFYIADTGNTIYDMHDETHHFSVHIVIRKPEVICSKASNLL